MCGQNVIKLSQNCPKMFCEFSPRFEVKSISAGLKTVGMWNVDCRYRSSGQLPGS